MDFTVAITTFNPMASLRTEMLRTTVQSVDLAFPRAKKLLLDNGSSDLSMYLYEELMEVYPQWGLLFNMASDGNTTPGRGRNVIMQHVREQLGDPADGHVVVFSDDDMRWHTFAQETIESFWSQAPKDVAILGGLLEPEYRHNTPRETIEHGGVRALVRDSTPGASWSFLYQEWHRAIGPVIDDFGYDTRCCEKLKKKGLKVAQMELAEHIGYGVSTHGNEQAMWTRPLDRDKWGV